MSHKYRNKNLNSGSTYKAKASRGQGRVALAGGAFALGLLALSANWASAQSTRTTIDAVNSNVQGAVQSERNQIYSSGRERPVRRHESKVPCGKDSASCTRDRPEM
jgi:VanZ family protein